MTDQERFVQDSNGQNQNTNQEFKQGDNQASNTDGVDTRDPQYQLQVMQQRLSDKDEFINTLKEENQQTREMYASLEERMQNLSNIEEVLNKRNEQDVGNQETTGLDEDALVGKVIENLDKKQAEQAQAQNYNQVLSRLSNEYGEHIEDKVSEAAQANGLSVEDMRNTARKSPKAFYRLMGLEAGPQRQTTPPPTRGSQTPPQDNQTKDFAYYSNLMRTNPREYWKPETQREFRRLFQKDK